VSAAGCPACLHRWPDAADRIADLGPAVLYLYEDQFFPGWTVLVLKRHATELYELSRAERAELMDAVSRVARALAAVYRARKINYALLGNLTPHIHWHVMPRLADDPIPTEPVWTMKHEPHRLAPAELAERVAAVRAALDE
jgi:diadenosine tetraphosphate (Ap4A) HIT family hydrolase